MIDSDSERENETHSARGCSSASTDRWMEDNVSRKLEDVTGVSGPTTEWNDQPSVSSTTEFISGQPK